MMLIEKFWTVEILILMSYGFNTLDSLAAATPIAEPPPTELSTTPSVRSSTTPTTTSLATPTNASSTTPSSVAPIATPTNTSSTTPPSVAPTNTSSTTPPSVAPIATPTNASSTTPSSVAPTATPTNASSTTPPSVAPIATPTNTSSTTPSAAPLVTPTNTSSTIPSTIVSSASTESSILDTNRESNASVDFNATTAMAKPLPVASHPTSTYGHGTDEKENSESGFTSPVNFLTYFIVVVVTLVICYLLYSNRQRLKTLYKNYRGFFSTKRSKGVTYKPIPIIINEQELEHYKDYVY